MLHLFFQDEELFPKKKDDTNYLRGRGVCEWKEEEREEGRRQRKRTEAEEKEEEVEEEEEEEKNVSLCAYCN